MKWVGWLWLLLLLVACGGSDGGKSVSIDDENVLFHDEFIVGQTGEWQLEGDDIGRTAVIDEQLQIHVDAPGTLQYATLLNPSFGDFILEVDARQLAGDPDSSYGLLLRMQGPGQFYRFEITADGRYMIERHNADGSWDRFLNDWTASPAIGQGMNAPNRLRIEAVGPDMSFYVNGTLLTKISDSQYATGTIALDAGTFSQPGLKAAFDNLILLRP